VPEAIFHPRRITHTVLAVADMDASLEYFERVAGLVCSARDDASASLHGSNSPLDLVLIRADGQTKPGLRGISFLVNDAAAVDAAERAARSASIPVRDAHDTAIKRNVVIEDPDGLMVEFYAPRTATLPLPSMRAAGASQTWYFAA